MVPTELNKAIMQARTELYVLNLSNGCHIGVIASHCTYTRTKTGFISDEDREEVLKGSPWSFDNPLLILIKPDGICDLEALDFTRSPFWIQIQKVRVACMTYKVANYLGNIVGSMAEVDPGALGDCEGKFL
ncbi:hypothetical protein Sjap_026177 [Stephania japonica]|uniref:DUF4283 domain-containing protein n=1 Tax=Stephania japonica TaxID=461633 RepID=A0AAP0E342_9MAGN